MSEESELAKDIFMSLEARHAQSVAEPPTRPPLPWNSKFDNVGYVEERAPHEHSPDAHDEWRNSGNLLESGRRRYSAYHTYGNRDGPQLAYGLHPSRSSLRPIVSSSVTVTASTHLECLDRMTPELKIGVAADSLECRKAGHHVVYQPDGTTRMAKGKPPPGGRPFSGYRSLVLNSSETMEANPVWQQERKKRPGVRIAGIGGKADEALMDQIVAQFPGSSSGSSSSRSKDW
mmetsp:Transcript_142/g.357  ORF Transcript_142/g.357 Transcript_142/m.357 type:complete len:232 (-) Transcript_142:1329-2024(-)